MDTTNNQRDAQEQLLACMLAANRKEANLLVDNWAAQNSYEHAVNDLLEPALQKFGGIWAGNEDVSLAQGYIAAKIAEDIMLKAAQTGSAIDGEQVLKGPIVVGNIEDDYHALGRKLVATFLRADGWQVIDLGNDVLPETFVDTALETGAKVIGVSAMMYVNAVNIQKLRIQIDRRNLTGKIQLAVGGAVFILHPELVAKVGGNGTARNALAAPALIKHLWAQATAVRGEL